MLVRVTPETTRAVVALLLLPVLACGTAPSKTGTASVPAYGEPRVARAALDSVFHRWRAAMGSLDPAAAWARGDRPIDAPLLPIDAASLGSARDALDRAISELDSLQRAMLAADVRASFDLLSARLRADRIQYVDLRRPERDASWAPRIALGVVGALSGESDDERASRAARLREIPAYLAASRELLRFPWRLHLEEGIAATERLAAVLLDLASAEGESGPAEAAASAAAGHAAWLRESLASIPLGHHSMGRTAFFALCSAESGFAIDGPYLVALGESELTKARMRLLDAAIAIAPDQLTPERSVAEALARAKASGVRGMEEALGVAARALDATRALVEPGGAFPGAPALRASVVEDAVARETLAVPVLRVRVRSDETRAVDATLRLPGIVIARPAGVSELGERPEPPARILLRVAEQLIPGAALQRATQSALESPIRRNVASETFRRGWAAYARGAAVDAGAGAETPYLALLRAHEDLLTAARGLAATRIQQGFLTLAEAATLFRNQGFLDARRADEEARRCAYDPLVALDLVGASQLADLAARLRSERGLSLRASHEEILRQGALPVPALAQSLLR